LLRKQKGSTPFIKIDPLHPDPEAVSCAADIIRQGGVVVFPTRNLYGLGTDALNPGAVDRIFKIKKRPSSKPLLVLIKSRDELPKLVRHIPAAAECLMDHFWPGRLTIILEAKDTLPANLTCGTGKIGVRLPGHPVALSLSAAVDSPISGTSANISGKPGCSNATELQASIIRKVDCILNAGQLQKGIGSTVVDISEMKVEIIREGSIPVENIRSVLKALSFNHIDIQG